MAEMITGARTFIALPPPPPLGGGVLSVANIIDTSGHELMGAIAEPSDACANVREWTEWCNTAPVDRKDFDPIGGTAYGNPVVVYASVSCDFQNLAEAEARARRRLAFGESRAVDKIVQEQIDLLSQAVGAAPAVYSVSQGIGVLEQYMATGYGGAPTLLIPRRFVACACGSGPLYSNLDGTLSTCSGSRVAPITEPGLDDYAAQGLMYATGSITLLRGPVSSYSVPAQILDNGQWAPPRALAERIYVPIFDCLTAEVSVTCDGTTP